MSGFIDTTRTLMQAGLLSLLGLELPRHHRMSWHALKSSHFSLPRALADPQFGFVPSYFLQRGALVVLKDRDAFSSDRQAALNEKLAKYGTLTPPILSLAKSMQALARPTGHSRNIERRYGYKRR